MRRPPPLRQAPRYPATAGTIAFALAVTFAWWGKADVSFLLEDARLAHGQLWRLFTSVLLHNDPFHLAFNCYWLWVFGTLIEVHLGSLKTLALYLFLAAGSGAAEFALLDGGVGLSGVGYGLFGMLWVLSRHDRARAGPFADAVDQQTVALFVAWFFLCLFLTVTDAWAVANIAHAAGALLGALVGWIMTIPTHGRRRRYWAIPAITVIALLVAATVARPLVNRSPHRGDAEAYFGYEALTHDRPAEAARWYRESVRMRPSFHESWYNLGIAYAHLEDYGRALDAYARAAELSPGDADYRTAHENLKTYLDAVGSGIIPAPPPPPASTSPSTSASTPDD